MQSKPWCFPGKLLLLMLTGWINRHQQAVIAYQREETKVLREMLGGRRLRFTDGQRNGVEHASLDVLRPLVWESDRSMTGHGKLRLRWGDPGA